MTENYVEVYCKGICCDNTIKINLPEGWFGEGVLEGAIYCKNCLKERDFFSAVCPGCVESFPYCAFGRIFNSISASRELTLDETQKIKFGKCPFRTNGTIIFNRKEGLKNIDISDKAPNESGIIVLKALKKYETQYQEYLKNKKVE